MISARMNEYRSEYDSEYDQESAHQIVDTKKEKAKNHYPVLEKSEKTSAYPEIGQAKAKSKPDLNSKSPVKIMYPPTKEDNSMNQAAKPLAYESF